ncbi:hypothetical protein Lesp02_14040 [Lentzea sp. NBRC 105346]|uniref:hypothetical protein n=1 Tax=Lentzea sp. NBRC 105346 TaxID=3032205 RepID=UPI0024A5733C|nr:hypothetical protein [Lentzea sp. NBRC 105346]GLZ29214.1 hypothetical protein Lesp02_14040 [Lentzea sp. NBRC 105346]
MGAPVIGLFLLAPFVGEFLLGNMRVDELWLGVILIPFYGGGALLVRELGRRAGGWPAMVLLAAAYALIEEGPVDQLLWNDSYAGHNLLTGDSYIPALGMSVELTQAVLALHTVWSICVPIAIVETFVPARRTTPWLGKIGLTVVALIYTSTATLVFLGNYLESHFLAKPAQLIGITVVIAALIALAFRVRPLPAVPGKAPHPLLAGVVAFLGTSLYWGPANLVTAGWYEWVGVAVWCLLVAVGVPLVIGWSGRDGWGQRHVFALAAGAVLTYVWVSFPVQPESGGSPAVDLAGNAVFGAIALVILVLAGRKAGVVLSSRGMSADSGAAAAGGSP